MQRVVDAAQGEQFFVGAEFLDDAVVQHEHPVALLNGLQPMGDDDRRAPLGELAQRVLNDQLRARVD